MLYFCPLAYRAYFLLLEEIEAWQNKGTQFEQRIEAVRVASIASGLSILPRAVLCVVQQLR